MVTWAKNKFSNIKRKFFRKKQIEVSLPEILQVEIVNPANGKVVQYSVSSTDLGPKDFDRIAITEMFVEFYLENNLVKQYGRQYLYCVFYKVKK